MNGRPELAQRIVSAIHMDMVGGSTEMQAVFHITRGPASLPSFIYDVADSIGEFVNEQTDEFASTGSAKFPLHSVEGEKRALQAALAPFSMGSDHQVYTDSSFNVPAIYFNDWPDRYIHTNLDTPANIDPTKLKRAAFMGAANAYFLSNLTEKNLPQLSTMIQSAALRRTAAALSRTKDKQHAIDFELWYERAVFDSLQKYVTVSDEMKREFSDFLTKLTAILGAKSNSSAANGTVYMRKSDLKGPMEAFGYSYLEDHYGKEKLKNIRLRDYQGATIDGSTYAYEALNFVDGKRSVQEITNLLSGAYGSVPQELIAEYLQALESIGVVSRKQ